MEIKFFATRWGNTQKWIEFLAKVKDEGYDGVEVNIRPDACLNELDDLQNNACKFGMALIAQHSKTIDADFETHCRNYEKWLQLIIPYKWTLVNTQTGKDYFTFEQNKRLINLATDYSVKHCIPIVHETHRGKFSFAAHITKQYLQQIPELRLALDISHWVAVAESYLTDQQEAVDMAIAHTDHLHARVGYIQGPQVPDPRSPEWSEALGCHLNWWDMLIAHQVALGKTEFTITPEFGPFPYMMQTPYSQQPLANQWEMNAYMKNLLRQRYV